VAIGMNYPQPYFLPGPAPLVQQGDDAGSSVVGGPVEPEATRVGDSVALRVGDRVLLDVVDRPAVAYLKTVGVANVPENDSVGVPITATVIKIEEDVIWVEHTAMAGRDTKSPRLITVTAEANRAQLHILNNPYTAPPGSPEWVIEAEHAQSQLPRLRIESLDKFVIREWSPARTVDDVP